MRSTPTQGTIAAQLGNVYADAGQTGTMGIKITGSFSATLTFEGTMNGTDWDTIPAYTVSTTPTLATGATSTGLWQCSTAGFAQFRVNCPTTYVSGTATVTLTPTAARIFKSPVAPPATPASLAAVGGTGNIAVSWNASVGATSYDLQYSPDNATWTSILGVTSTYTDSNAKIAIGVTGILYYQVRANNAGGSSAWSSSVNVGINIPALSPIAWIKADGTKFQDTAGTTPAVADGDPVARVNDAGAGGNNVTVSLTTRRPLLKLAIQNGMPVLRGDGVDDFLAGSSLSAFNALHNGTGGTALWMGKKTAADGTTTGLFGNNSGTSAKIGYSMFMASGNLFGFVTNGTGTSVITKSVAVAQGTSFVVLSRYRTGASPAYRIRVNGGADATLAETGSPSVSNSANGMGILCTDDSGQFQMGGDQEEFLAIPSDVSDANAALLITYSNVRGAYF